MLEVVCVNAGNYQGRGVEYVRNLNDMVRRNLPAGYAGRFTVFTDDDLADYGPEVIVRDLPEPGLEGWWNKLALFKPGVFERGTHVLFLDLDTLITGRMDAAADYRGGFAILRDFFRPEGWGSSMMGWTVGEASEAIWSDWNEAGRPRIVGGDQSWIEMAVEHADIWQDMHPGAFVSYKLSGGIAPAKAAMVMFHGLPRPHEILTGWVPMVWKEGGMTRAELDAVCNTAIEAVHANVRSACARDLPWFDFQWCRSEEQVCIVGGAPSLKDSLDTIRWRQGLGQKVWALNGAAAYLMDNGITPDGHVVIDAKPECAAFVAEPHRHTHYYIASQCDPGVLDALAYMPHVTLIHCQSEGMAELLGDEVERPVHLLGAGTTVAMKAMLLAELRGFCALHLIGVDSCYSDKEHHAYPQGWNEGEMILDLIYGERNFKCAPWMVGQAQDFVEYAHRFTGIITVDGDGLLAHIARIGLPESDVDVRAREILARLPAGPLKGAEIGVFCGELSERLLASKSDLKLHLVDSWGDYEPSFHASEDYHANLPQDYQEKVYRRTCEAVSMFNGRAVIHRAKSLQAAEKMAEGLDFVFIDADHSYEGCRADIEAWAPKVRPGGLLSGHDYDNTDYPKWGVKRAVDEFVAANGLQLELGDNFTWFARTQGA